MKNALTLLVGSFLLSSAPSFAVQFDRDVPENIQKQILNDLSFMHGIDGKPSSALHGQIFGSRVQGAFYSKFFSDRMQKIGMNACGGGNAVACVIPLMGSNKMWLTKNYVQFSHPQVARAMVVFHEARHGERENGNWGHARCPKPFRDPDGREMRSIWTGAALAGEPACDVTPFGSYGSSVILLKNIQLGCENCSEKVRMDAGLYADDQFGRITDAKAREAMKKDIYEQKRRIHARR